MNGLLAGVRGVSGSVPAVSQPAMEDVVLSS
jgi:hypothetical protein